MFMKKLVDKASLKKPGGFCDGLKSGDVQPRLAFHYGIPPGATLLAYDDALNILAISTRDGRIKLFGKDNTQVLLESPDSLPSKFLQFIQKKGILLNVTSNNHIEVWDLDKKILSHVHDLKDDITAFTVMQHTEYIYVGDSIGNVSVLKLNKDTFHIAAMNYTIPLFASYGNSTEVSADVAVFRLLPQPTAESKRFLIVFEDGLIALWEIRESRTIFTTGGTLMQAQNTETKKVSSACWACPFGSRLAVGYTNGEIFIWSIPAALNTSLELAPNSYPQSGRGPTCKLNLGYRSERIPISSLKWHHEDGKASRLYVLGAPDLASTNLLQVVLLNDHTESRTIKLGLHLSEPCFGMEIISSFSDRSKHKQDMLVLLGKSGHIYVYDDAMIERNLLQSQSRGSPSLPKELVVKMPLVDSAITISKFITNSPSMLNLGDEDYMLLAKNILSLFPLDGKPRDGTHMFPAHFTGFRKIKNLYITGHSDGAVNFWDVSCPFFIPILSLKQQSEDDFTVSGIAVTALYFDVNSRLLISGDHSGMVRIIKFKPEPYSNDNNFLAFQGSSRKGNNHYIQSFKLAKVNGSVLSLNVSSTLGRLAVGSDQGFVSLIDLAEATVLHQKHIATEMARGIISLQFEMCSLHGFEKHVLVVAAKDSSVLALDSDTGNMLSSSSVHPKKPCRALFMQVLDARHMLAAGSNMSSTTDQYKRYSVEDGQKYSFLLLCTEKAAYVYSLNHAIQGVKKVHCKKKFQSSSCCWASTFYGETDVGLILLFSTGKMELRSLPDLTLIRDSSIRSFVYSAPKLNSLSGSFISCSEDGELLMMNDDQEMFVVSLLHQTENFRNLDAISRVCWKDLTPSEEELGSATIVQKEKKKGLFSIIIKDMKGNKQKQVPELEREDTRESIEELSAIFSINNFPSNNETKESLAMGDDDDDLGIDNIDLNDPSEKAKDQNPLVAFSKEKLASKFQAFKGKIKQTKAKKEKTIKKEDEKDEKAGAIDQIKKKYGFPQSSESNAAKLTESKLRGNVRMLQELSSIFGTNEKIFYA